MCVKTEKDKGLRHFKLSRYERPEILHWVSYDGYILTCSCCNLEFARIVCRHSLAVAVQLSLTQLDPFYFPKCWQKDPSELELAKDYVNFYNSVPGILTLYELSSKSSSECAS